MTVKYVDAVPIIQLDVQYVLCLYYCKTENGDLCR